MTQTLETTHHRTTAKPARPVRRTWDSMIVDRVVPGDWRYPEPSAEAYEEWPFLVAFCDSADVDVEINGATTTLRAGELMIVRNRTRLRMQCEPGGTAILLCLPRGTVDPYRQAFERAAGQTWQTMHGGTASIIGHLLHGLIGEIEALAPRSPGRFAQHLVGFLAVMCSDIPTTSTRHHDVLERAKAYIEGNLGNIDLTPDAVAADQFVSTRTLHRVFETEGHTVGGWIRQRRLENCRLDLDDDTWDSLPVSRIGTKWGLWDAAHFSRIFKSTYGSPPRQYRASRRADLSKVEESEAVRVSA